MTRTPFRISFFGGGTDYPVFCTKYGGAVLSTSINRYCYVTCRYLPPFFDHKYRIRYTRREETNTIDEIEHPSVKACLKHVGIDEGLEILHTSDIPACSGVGSSSAFTVGLLNALHSLNGKIVTKRQLAQEAIHVEQNIICENVGSQDQIVTSFGGLNKIVFTPDGNFFVNYLTLGQDKLEYLNSSLMFYFLGFSRYSSEIAVEQVRNTSDNTSQLLEMMGMVDQGVDILNGDIEHYGDFGRLMDETWKLKRGLSSKISTPFIDEVYEKAMGNGALGGKVCGAGGGGFIVFFVPPERQPAFKVAMGSLLQVPMRFENIGTHVVFYST